MAKKKEQKPPKSRADHVRAAVEQAFAATAEQAEQTRGRAQDIADELAQAATRLRDVLDELRPPTADELRSMRERIDALEAKVAELESAGAKKATPARKPAARKPAARKPAARKPAARSSSTARKPASRGSSS